MTSQTRSTPRIVVGVDGSAASERALDQAEATGATVEAINV